MQIFDLLLKPMNRIKLSMHMYFNSTIEDFALTANVLLLSEAQSENQLYERFRKQRK